MWICVIVSVCGHVGDSERVCVDVGESVCARVCGCG